MSPLPMICMDCNHRFLLRIGEPKCPQCGSYDVAYEGESKTARMPEWETDYLWIASIIREKYDLPLEWTEAQVIVWLNDQAMGQHEIEGVVEEAIKKRAAQ